MASERASIPPGWPQPDGTIIAAVDAALMRTAERYPWAARVMGEMDRMPDQIRRQFEADLCAQLGMALHAKKTS